MLPIRTILHPTDFSDRSGYALQLAAALARDYHARLVILHVISRPVIAYGNAVVPDEPEIVRNAAQEQLDGLLIPGGGLLAERRLAEGDPAEVILHVAREIPADLVVVGTHGRTGLRRVLMGSVAEQVVRRAPCPVLTVTTPFPATPAAPVAEAMGVAGPM
jgi:nucleotide-binding universal stress UspA family protein